MGDGYQVDPQALTQASHGINGTIEGLRDLGIVGTGDVGRGFSQLSLSGMDLGHTGTQEALEEFTTRWAWGVRTLVQDANEIAVRLDLNAGKYHLMEQYGEATMKQVAVNLVGDPRMSGEEAGQQSWDDIWGQTHSTDYSGESFEEGWDNSSEAWEHTAEDWWESRTDPGAALEDEVSKITGDDGQG